MKLFSRKAIAAVAASVALTTAGVAAPAFAAESSVVAQGSAESFGGSSAPGEGEGEGSPAPGEGEGEGSPAPGEGEGEGSPATGEGEGKGSPATGEGEGKGSSLDTSDPKSITGWVGVFTAIISALSAAFVFFQRITA